MHDEQNDPISVAVISNRLSAITKEMGQIMLLTSRSPIFSESRDFVTAIFDGNGRLVAQTSYIPVLLGAIPFALEAIRGRFKPDELHPGDVIVANDPYQGNSHLPDVTIARPVFHQEQLVFWAVTKGHQADLGGGGVAGYNPTAKTVWEEGLRLPPIKLYSQGKYQKDVWDFILLNVKSPHLVEGDLHCQIGAAARGEEALLELLDRYGRNSVASAIDSYLDATERAMAAAIRRIPDGSYSGESRVDNDGIKMDQVPCIRVAVQVAGDRLTFDFGASDPQSQGFVNSPFANTASVCFQALFACIGAAIPINFGSLGLIRIVAPEGSIVNCRPPAPTTASTLVTCAAIAEAIWIALAEAIPGQVQAGWGRRCAPMTAGKNPRTGRPFVCTHHNCKGGSGATEGYDGWNHTGPVSNMGGSRATDPEIFELAYPYRLFEYEFARDTAGAGKWRGGVGAVLRWKVETPDIQCVTVGSGMLEETRSFGLFGGKPGSLPVMRVTGAGGETREIGVNRFYDVSQGDVFELISQGGGGFGDPFERPPDQVRDDVVNGFVSMAKALEDYGVALKKQDRELIIDFDETVKCRALSKSGSAVPRRRNGERE
ncbi:MAG TPA: hydantoinase B/oxoprolinase family protein [Candidatus Acidoferrales bacterium]|nr:hydantoinase B/oxoprolinase family protein [Candidatus Acidoferrales bacterium]